MQFTISKQTIYSSYSSLQHNYFSLIFSGFLIDSEKQSGGNFA